MSNLKSKIASLKSKMSSKNVALVAGASAIVGSSIPVFATTGNTDLDTMLTAMTDGLDVMAKGGVLIIGAVIAFAITFIAARWLFGLFKQWSGKAS